MPPQRVVNFRDNVEQVDIPVPTETGVWTAQVAIATSISNDVQAFTLCLTGHDDEVDRTPRFLSQPAAASGVQLEWDTLTGKVYRVERATNLLETDPFSEVMTVVTGEFISTQFVDTNASPDGTYYYRILEE